MNNRDYIPGKGDIVWIDFNPQSGHEQAGRRPALVLSPYNYNAKIGLVLVCPITSKVKNFSFETKIPENININGVILSDQIKSFDWKKRNVDYISTIQPNTFNEVIDKLGTLLEHL